MITSVGSFAVRLESVGKKFNYNWIFNKIDFEFQSPGRYGILGRNGSGKSSLLKIIAGYSTPSEGKVLWFSDKNSPVTDVHRFLGYASPHLDIIEDFTLAEAFHFHGKFRSFTDGLTALEAAKITGLNKSIDKPLKYFSSGMKQRVKIALAVLGSNPMILLDEPCSNLDDVSVQWYKDLLDNYLDNRLLIIGSNDKETECHKCNLFMQL